MNSSTIEGAFDFDTYVERMLEHEVRLQGGPADATSIDQREAQVFACLAKGLSDGFHREFVREIDRCTPG